MHPILKMVLQRLCMGFITLLVISIIIFTSVEFLPGDLAQEILGQGATPEAVAAFRAEVGLDEPPLTRYFDWLGGILHGDFGKSLATKRDIAELIDARLGNTLFLAGVAALISVPVSVALGLLAALYRNSWFDRMINISTLSAISLPDFFVAYILILFLSVGYGFDARWLLFLLGLFLLVEGVSAARSRLKEQHLPLVSGLVAIAGFALVLNAMMGWWTLNVDAVRLFPSISNIGPDTSFLDRLHRSVLPALTLTLVVAAYMIRMTRASIVNLLASSYIEMARLKGIKPGRVIVKHALPNALAPIINVIAFNLAFLVTGVVVVEVVFVYPGLGQLLVDSVSKRDITVVQAACLIFAATYILLNLIADVLAIATNPRLLHPK